MQGIEIRVAKREELPKVVTLYNLMWVGKKPIDIKTGENIFDRMQKRSQAMYVVTLDGRVVGTFMVLIKADDDGLQCVVENVVVHPKYQRRGIGKQVMAFVTEKCKEEGCHRLVVSSSDKRESSAQFYESQGFERRGYSFVKRID